MNTIDSLAKEIIKLQIQNAETLQKIEAVNNLYQNRFTDLYVWIGIFLTLLAGIVFLNFNSSKRIAKDEAEKELEIMKTKFNEALKEMKTNFSELQEETKNGIQTVNNLIETLKQPKNG